MWHCVCSRHSSSSSSLACRLGIFLWLVFCLRRRRCTMWPNHDTMMSTHTHQHIQHIQHIYCRAHRTHTHTLCSLMIASHSDFTLFSVILHQSHVVYASMPLLHWYTANAYMHMIFARAQTINKQKYILKVLWECFHCVCIFLDENQLDIHHIIV